MRTQIFRGALLAGAALNLCAAAQAQDAATPAAPQSSVATVPQPSPNAAPPTTVDSNAQVTNAAPGRGVGPGPGGAAGDIIVTARQREEKLQNVPVSVSAFSAVTLQRSSVQTISDIRSITPGLTFS